MTFLVFVLFIVCFAPFLLLMIFISIRKRNKKFVAKKIKDIHESSPYRKKQNNQKPNNDFLFLHKQTEKEKDEQFDQIQKMDMDMDMDMDEGLEPKEEGKIVGVAEPKGFWSRLIMSQKMNFIMAKIDASENKGQGFWVNLIKAQDASQGKNKSRGR